jgi:MFS family permease
MSSAAGTPGVFASRTFRRYFLGQSLSFIGDGLRLLSVPLLAYHLTHSALSTGTALICEIAPFSLFALVGGSLADRLDRRKLMIGCDAVRFTIMALFAVGYAFHVLTLPMIYGGLVIISICAAGFLGGQASSIPYVLGSARATRAIAVLMAAENGSNLITPAIGGAIFAYFGPLPALVINALTYLASQISLAFIPSLGPDRAVGMPTLGELFADVKLGYRQVWTDLGMRTQAIAAFVFNLFGFGGYSILIPFLKRTFAASDQQVGMFFGISAAGAITGAVLAARFPERWPFGRVLVIAYLFDALIFLPVVFVKSIWAAAFFWAVSNALANFEVAQVIGFRIRVTPEQMVGRVMGAVRLFVLAGIAPAVLLFGWVADHRTPLDAMFVAAFGFLTVAVAVAMTPAIRNEVR